MQDTRVQFLGREDPLEKEVATHPSTLAWKIPWTEEPGGLHRVHRVAKESDTTEHAHTCYRKDKGTCFKKKHRDAMRKPGMRKTQPDNLVVFYN